MRNMRRRPVRSANRPDATTNAAEPDGVRGEHPRERRHGVSGNVAWMSLNRIGTMPPSIDAIATAATTTVNTRQ